MVHSCYTKFNQIFIPPYFQAASTHQPTERSNHVHLNPQSRFAEFIDDFGQPETSRPVSAATLNKYRGRLPDRLLEYWQEHGFCHFADGLFWLTNPEDYEDILAEWLPENVQ